MEVFPPKTRKTAANSSGPILALHPGTLKRRRSSSESLERLSKNDAPPPHIYGSNLSNKYNDSVDFDNPHQYFYKVQILEEERNSHDKDVDGDDTYASTRSSKRESGRMKDRHSDRSSDLTVDVESGAKWAGSLMEVQCDVMTCVVFFASY